MTTNHIDQLAEWWETAEEGSPRPGDTIIIDLGSGGYMIETASEHWGDWERYSDTRILARAPKPKPAWHDAVAVIATFDITTSATTVRDAIWIREEDGTWFEPAMEIRADGYELSDVTPLIEAKVTVGAVARVSDALHELYGTHDNSDAAAEIITAALGLETA